jgi:hypothetical protein
MENAYFLQRIGFTEDACEELVSIGIGKTYSQRLSSATKRKTSINNNKNNTVTLQYYNNLFVIIFFKIL